MLLAQQNIFQYTDEDLVIRRRRASCQTIISLIHFVTILGEKA